MNQLLKRSLAFLIVIAMIVPTIAIADTKTDYENHWAKATIEKWVKNGNLKGYQDGTVRPNNTVTRAEFITMVNNSFGYSGDAVVPFEDVKNIHWFYGQVKIALANKYIAGMTPTTFGPNMNITREQACVIVANIKKLPASKEELKFSDKGMVATWAKESVASMVEAKLLSGYPDGSFKPKAPLTRAEAVVILDKAIDYKPGEVKPVDPVKPVTPTPPSSGGGGGGGGGGSTTGSAIDIPVPTGEYTFTFKDEDGRTRTVTRDDNSLNKDKLSQVYTDQFKNSNRMTEFVNTLNDKLDKTTFKVKLNNGTILDVKLKENNDAWKQLIAKFPGQDSVASDIKDGTRKKINKDDVNNYVTGYLLKAKVSEVVTFVDNVTKSEGIFQEYAVDYKNYPSQVGGDRILGELTLGNLYNLWLMNGSSDMMVKVWLEDGSKSKTLTISITKK